MAMGSAVAARPRRLTRRGEAGREERTAISLAVKEEGEVLWSWRGGGAGSLAAARRRPLSNLARKTEPWLPRPRRVEAEKPEVAELSSSREKRRCLLQVVGRLQ
ncbi:hypothetical protein IEQ34_015279 [Dendrobium chrysotoxum]|uniref:Uncharacterized protein n=1 Tax=Dendrobium chrysotoxum TaxID=161865 RepID=A0AAV7GG96_DENCH|nr:hypothetical protein IEQ34_015279 [Dendrobium chrysotoxum]